MYGNKIASLNVHCYLRAPGPFRCLTPSGPKPAALDIQAIAGLQPSTVPEVNTCAGKRCCELSVIKRPLRVDADVSELGKIPAADRLSKARQLVFQPHKNVGLRGVVGQPQRHNGQGQEPGQVRVVVEARRLPHARQHGKVERERIKGEVPEDGKLVQVRDQLRDEGGRGVEFSPKVEVQSLECCSVSEQQLYGAGPMMRVGCARARRRILGSHFCSRLGHWLRGQAQETKKRTSLENEAFQPLTSGEDGREFRGAEPVVGQTQASQAAQFGGQSLH